MKIFSKHKDNKPNELQNKLDELQKRIERLIPKDSDKFLFPAKTIKDYSESIYLLLDSGYLVNSDIYYRQARSVITKYCAILIFNMSIIVSGLGSNLNDIIENLEKELEVAEEAQDKT